MLRFIKKLKSRVNKLNEEDSSLNPNQFITVEEIYHSEKLWIEEIQKDIHTNEHYNSWEKNLGLFTDADGILRCKGRFRYSSLNYDEKHPAIIPRDHRLTSLIVSDAHSKVLHGGVANTLAKVREKFWIIRGRQLVKKAIKNCAICRRFEGVHYKLSPIADLPDFRTDAAPAFTNVGIDFAGPLYVKDKEQSSSKKAYVVLFSCLVSRALHLEVVPDQSVESFLLALRRFIARRGIPKLILSDNAKTFKKSNSILKKLFKSTRIHEFLLEHLITWRFILVKSPWWGGAYERVVKEIKRPLRKILGNASLSMDELTTVIIEIEASLNSRPLTYVSDEDWGEPLTPSHLVVGRKISNLPDYKTHDFEDPGQTSTLISKRMKHLSKLLEHFWRRWQKEYLLGLREQHRLSPRRNIGNFEISVGDVVIIHEEGLPRSRWRLGRICTLIKGKDGHVRGARVTVCTKQGKISEIERPLQKLYPLELSDSDEKTTKSIVDNDGSNEAEADTEVRVRPEVRDRPGGRDRPPRRSAALNADIFRRLANS